MNRWRPSPRPGPGGGRRDRRPAPPGPEKRRGGIVLFDGTVRDDDCEALELEAYEAAAVAELERVARDAGERHRLAFVAVVHRTGRLAVGENILVIVAAAGHRAEAFAACREILEAIKAGVPIWKKEYGPGGDRWSGASTGPPRVPERRPCASSSTSGPSAPATTVPVPASPGSSCSSWPAAGARTFRGRGHGLLVLESLPPEGPGRRRATAPDRIAEPRARSGALARQLRHERDPLRVRGMAYRIERHETFSVRVDRPGLRLVTATPVLLRVPSPGGHGLVHWTPPLGAEAFVDALNRDLVRRDNACHAGRLDERVRVITDGTLLRVTPGAAAPVVIAGARDGPPRRAGPARPRVRDRRRFRRTRPPGLRLRERDEGGRGREKRYVIRHRRPRRPAARRGPMAVESGGTHPGSQGLHRSIRPIRPGAAARTLPGR